jgi:hypothetical protein
MCPHPTRLDPPLICYNFLFDVVLGLIEPAELGVTWTHEHLSMEFNVAYCEPEGKNKGMELAPFTLPNLGFIRQYP